MLLFCRRWYRRKGSQEAAITNEFGVSATRFWQDLRALAARAEAVAFAPDVCRRYGPKRTGGAGS